MPTKRLKNQKHKNIYISGAFFIPLTLALDYGDGPDIGD
jgi:hypothetical protein